MASWPRAIRPATATPLQFPGALASWSDSGKAQHRSTGQIGVMWTETYPAFHARSVEGQAFLAFIGYAWRNGITFDIDHVLHPTRLGVGTGTPRIDGAGQTGDTILTDGWLQTYNSGPSVLLAGSILTIGGVSGVRMAYLDATPTETGEWIIPITPPIFAGAAPGDNALLTVNDVRIAATIAERPNLPPAGVDMYIQGLSVTFREAP